MMRNAAFLVAAAWATAAWAQPAKEPVVGHAIADFEDGSLEGWQSSMSGEYYQGGHGQKGLGIVDDAERGGKALAAKLRWTNDRASEPAFITRFLPERLPAHLITSVTFSYRLSGYHLDDAMGFKVRLRYSDTSFTDYDVSTGEPLPAGEWQTVTLDTRPGPSVRNIYGSLFGTVREVTFRLDDVDEENAEFELRLDDISVTSRQPIEMTYEPKQESVQRDQRLDVLYLKHSAEGFFPLEEALGGDARIDTHLFRGLHFPFFDFPKQRRDALAYDLIVMLDVDPYVLTYEQATWIADAVASGAGMLFVAGPNTLYHSKDFKAPIASVLPATFKAEAKDSAGGTVEFAAEHATVAGLDPERLGRVRTMATVTPRAGAMVPLTSGGFPLLILGEVGEDRTAMLTTWPQISAPRQREFYQADHSVALLGQVTAWLTRSAAEVAPPPARRTVEALPAVELAGYAWHGGTAFAPGWPVKCGATLSVTGSPTVSGAGASADVSLPGGGLSVGLPTMADLWVYKPGSEEVYHSFGGGEALSHTTDPGLRAKTVTEMLLRAQRTDGNVFGEDDRIATVRRTLEVKPGGVVACTYEYEFAQGLRVSRMPVTLTFPVGAYAGTPFTLTGSDADQEGVLPPDEDDRRDTILNAHGLDLTLETEAGPVRIVCPDPERRAWLRDLRKYDIDLYRLELEGAFAGREAKAGDTYTVAFEIHLPDGAADAPDIGALQLAARLLEGEELASARPVWDIGTEPAAGDVTFEGELPNLESGAYWLSFELGEPGEEPLAMDAVACRVVDPLDRERFFPIISMLGTSGGGHRLDEAGVEARVDDLWRVGFNTVAHGGGGRRGKTRVTDLGTLIEAHAEGYAFSRGMASILEYTHYTRLSRDGRGEPSPFAPESMEATRRHAQPYLDIADINPRVLSVKVVDEPITSESALGDDEHTRRAFTERYGGELKLSAQLGDDSEARLKLAQFVGDYVAEEYRQGYEIKQEGARAWDLLLTYCSPGLGYGRSYTSLEDVLKWSRHVDRIDFDVYPYFYPSSQKLRMVQANYAHAFQRCVAQHLEKPFGFYVELDDRNYPFQVNPPEASAECAYTAIGQGVTYLNSFINQAFGTGVQSRPERWEHLGRELPSIRRIGPMLLKLERPKAPVAVLYPMIQAKANNGTRVPHYTFALLNGAFGDVDLLHEEVLLEAGIPEECRALALVATEMLARGTYEAVVEFVKGGGLLIVDETLPETDEKGEALEWGPEFAAKAAGDMPTPQWARLGEGHICRLPADVETLVKAAVEGGDALSPDIADPQAFAEWHGLVREVFAEASRQGATVLPNAATVDDTAQIEVGVRRNTDTTLLIITNHDDEARRAVVRVPELRHGYGFAADLRTMKPANGLVKRTGKGVEVTARLEGRHSTMIALYPARPEAAQLAAPSSVRRGEELAYRLGVEAEGLHLIEVTVTDAEGVARSRYGGAFAVEGGGLDVSVPVADNAATGEWRIVAALPVTGKTAEARFTVD